MSPRTLGYYDEGGLLRPAVIDDHTGYRWCSADRLDRLNRLNRILALRDLGLCLGEIGQILDEEVSPPELRAMLRLRQLEAHQQVDAEVARLAREEARPRRKAVEDRLGDCDVVVKALESEPADRRAGLVLGWSSAAAGLSQPTRSRT